MNKSTIAVVGVAVGAIVAGAVVLGDDGCRDVIVRCTVLDGGYKEALMPAQFCKGVGIVGDNRQPLPDSHVGCAVENVEKDKPKKEKRVKFSCAHRPHDMDASECGLINPDGGNPIDFGAENTMQPGKWVGKGCVARPCVEVAGVPWKGE